MTKTISIKRRLALLLALAFTCVAQGWATSTYYAKLTAKATPTGSGTVYASTEKKEPESTDYKENINASGSTTNENGAVTFYAYAQAVDGYHFIGWATSESGEIESTTIPYETNITTNKNNSSESTAASKTIFARFEENTEQKIEFIKPTNGTYSATYGTTTIEDYHSVTTKEKFTLTATPASGYKVFGWYTSTDNGATKAYFSTETTVKDYTFTENVSVGCDFVTSSTPIFIVKGSVTPYQNLNDADNAANDKDIIVLFSDGTLAAGDYSVSKNHTLLIPFDADYTNLTNKPKMISQSSDPQSLSSKPYKTLSFASGANLTVKGTVCIGGQQKVSSNKMSSTTQGPGRPVGDWGHIDMSNGGNITLESGGILYAWGFITGQNKNEGNNTSTVGTIVAKDGATVYEDFIMADWRGGKATKYIYDNRKTYRVFPFCSYIVPNIEVPLTIEEGATENVITGISASGGLIEAQEGFPFFGTESTTNALFQIKSGKVKKWYDPTEDEQCIQTDGDINVNEIKFEISSYKLSSSDYVLPLCGNMNFNINSGTFTLSYDGELQPGAKITIGKDAEATVSGNLYVFDCKDWDIYAYGSYRIWSPENVHPTKHLYYSDWTKPNGVESAKLEVDGKLNVNGQIYTTTNGADICNEGTGSIVYATAPTSPSQTLYQTKNAAAKSSDFDAISVTAAQLHNANADYPYTATAGMTLDEDNGTSHTVYYRDGVWGPYFQYNSTDNGSLVLDNNYPVKATDVTKAVSEKCAGSKPLSIDLSNADIEGGLTTGNIATLRAAMGATATTDADGNTVAATNPNGLLLVPSTISGIESDETENVVVVTGTGDNRTATAKSLVITDKQPLYVPTDLTVGTVTYTRTNTTNDGEKQWGTICLPYKLTSGDNIQYYKLGSVDLDKNTMTFERVETVAPNVPAIYATTQTGGTLEIGGSTVEVKTTTAESKGEAVTFGDGQAITLVGVQKATKQLTTADNGTCYYISKNKFWTTTKNAVNVKPQRAYFEVTGGTGAKVFTIGEADGAPTFIEGIGTDGAVEVKAVGVYSTSGARQNGLQPGLNIVRFSDGSTRKIIVK